MSIGKIRWFKEKLRDEREEQGEERDAGKEREGRRKKKTPETEGVLFIPYTPGSSLKKDIQRIEDAACRGRMTGRIRVTERVGRTISAILTNMTPWKREECGRELCKTCVSQPGRCRDRNATYQITCLSCKSQGRDTKYFGETHRTIYDRIFEQADLLRQESAKSALWSHFRDTHLEEEETPNFCYKVLRQYKSSTERQVAEAVLLDEFKGELMNRKSEFGMRNQIPRLKTHYRETEWKDRPDGDSGVSRTERASANGEGDSPNPAEESSSSIFETQFRQRKMKRKLESEISKNRDQTVFEISSEGDKRHGEGETRNQSINLSPGRQIREKDVSFSSGKTCPESGSDNNPTICNTKHRKKRLKMCNMNIRSWLTSECSSDLVDRTNN